MAELCECPGYFPSLDPAICHVCFKTIKRNCRVIVTTRQHKGGKATVRFYYKDTTPKKRWEKLLGEV